MEMEIPKFNPANQEREKNKEARDDEEVFIESPEDENIELGQIEKYEQLLGAEETEQIRDTIRNLQEPMKKMLEPIIKNINHGDYQLLIGDDASGRIPTLIIRKLINTAYNKNLQHSIPTRFIAGSALPAGDDPYSKGENEHSISGIKISHREAKKLVETKGIEVKKYISNFKNKSREVISNAIVVTEYISSGGGLVPMIKALKDSDIKPMVLTIYIDSNEDTRDYIEKERLKCPIFYGKTVHAAPPLYYAKKLSGVTKHFSDLHATPRRSWLPDDEKKVVLAKMTIARDEANKVADKLISELLG